MANNALKELVKSLSPTERWKLESLLEEFMVDVWMAMLEQSKKESGNGGLPHGKA